LFLIDLVAKTSRRIFGPTVFDGATFSPSGQQVLIQPAAGQQGIPQLWNLSDLLRGNKQPSALRLLVDRD
jgi:hypothetical protein